MWSFNQSLWQDKLWLGQVGATFSEEVRNEVSSVDLMSLPNHLPQRSRDGILPGEGLFAIKQGESYDASFLQ
jgi:hypothetical protein